MPTDEELLGLWCGGDERAGGRLFERHFPTLFGFFRNTSVGSVEDLVQDTFLACIEGRDRIRSHSNFRGYMLATARYILYRAIDQWNRKGSRIDPSVSSLYDVDPSPSRVLVEKIEHRALVEAMRRIPVDNQVALHLYYLQGFSAPALAEILGISEAGVRGRLRRGLDYLGEKLAALGQSARLLDASTEDLEQWLRELAPVVCPPPPANEDGD